MLARLTVDYTPMLRQPPIFWQLQIILKKVRPLRLGFPQRALRDFAEISFIGRVATTPDFSNSFSVLRV
jgi:hypothetical protein